jgi:hypothetical protein
MELCFFALNGAGFLVARLAEREQRREHESVGFRARSIQVNQSWLLRRLRWPFLPVVDLLVMIVVARALFIQTRNRAPASQGTGRKRSSAMSVDIGEASMCDCDDTP